jgi:hypothetical protein
MIEPTALAEVRKAAHLSDCGTYRYDLVRRWNYGGTGLVRWIMLNPSTADAEVDDATIRRCCGFARAWGYDGILVHNLYALRATDPAELRRHPDPIGPENDAYLASTVFGPTVCAWGVHAAPDRASGVLAMLRARGITPACLGRTKHGQPRHPLYLPATAQPEEL